MRGLVALFEDLEQQAYGLQLQERDDEVDELGIADYGSVDLMSRLHASVGSHVVVSLADGARLSGSLERVGADFGLLDDGHATWLFRPATTTRIEGLSARSMIELALPVLARLGVTSMLRRLAEERAGCVVGVLGSERIEGRVLRVGSDFFEVVTSDRTSATSVVPIRALTAIRIGR